ncbi:MAG TPA: hypothetical protein VMJ10_19425 [Kofleriaceae bacterium]|nr:hypothetical protein [Kofleriaceae bacterium]
MTLDAESLPDAESLLAEAQFLLAQVLWEPRIDRGRALRIARIAAKSHPDPRARAAIARWLGERIEPSLDDADLLASQPRAAPRRHPLPPPRRLPQP